MAFGSVFSASRVMLHQDRIARNRRVALGPRFRGDERSKRQARRITVKEGQLSPVRPRESGDPGVRKRFLLDQSSFVGGKKARGYSNPSTMRRSRSAQLSNTFSAAWYSGLSWAW